MMDSFTATYSPEDNKLRIYAEEYFDDEMLQRVKDHGFRWAPKQKLFVAPSWTPAREDFCIELAGEITAEQTTLVERAEAKAERLDALAIKRSQQSSSYHDAANRISERFAAGQPILVGHHSERRARKDQERMHNAMANAVAAQEAVSYWNWKAEGVEHHANMKSCTRTRLNRIKTLLAELRDCQRDINHAHLCLDLWTNIETKKDDEDFAKTVEHWAGMRLKSGGAAPSKKGESMYSRLTKGVVTPLEAVETCLSFWDFQKDNPGYLRWINHILNRLDYERFELGEVPHFSGDLTPVILQTFCRTHGADKPKASKTEKGFKVVSAVPLPLHIAEGKEVILSVDEWRDLMQSVGYEVIIKERKKPTKQTCPLINPTSECAQQLQSLWNSDSAKRAYGGPSQCLEATQKIYSAHSQGEYSDFKTVELDATGRIISGYRNNKPTPVCRVRIADPDKPYRARRLIILTDKPQKTLPVDFDEKAEEVA